MRVGFEAEEPSIRSDGDAYHADCLGRVVLTHVTGRWGALIVSALDEGPLRFYRLRDRIDGISEKVLSQNLRVLARDGLIQREVKATTPPQVTYSLTPLGCGLAVQTRELISWIAEHAADIAKAQLEHDSAAAG